MISFSFSPDILFIIMCKLIKFQASSYYTFQDIKLTKFHCQNFQRAITKKIIHVFIILTDNLLIMIYKLIKFQAFSSLAILLSEISHLQIFLPANLIIILYHLIKFQASSYKYFLRYRICKIAMSKFSIGQ